MTFEEELSAEDLAKMARVGTVGTSHDEIIAGLVERAGARQEAKDVLDGQKAAAFDELVLLGLSECSASLIVGNTPDEVS